METLVEHLPCAECAGHLREWVGARPIEPAAAHQWFVDLHNHVNVRILRQIWSEEMVVARYGSCLDPDIMLINLCPTVDVLDEYMDKAVATSLREMISALLLQ